MFQLDPRANIPELFALHMPREPVSQALGGAGLRAGHTVTRVEPYGVVRFDPGSRDLQIQEPEERHIEVMRLLHL